jgi:hypothetical protein
VALLLTSRSALSYSFGKFLPPWVIDLEFWVLLELKSESTQDF